MTLLEKRVFVREILLKPRFLRLQQIAMAVDYSLDKDRKENRYTHSIEVANASEIMNDCLSAKLGFNTDPLNCSYIIGMLHDVGHTAFGHEGERRLNTHVQSLDPEINFFGNSNNYVAIQKNGFLDSIAREDRDFILASLAKHPEELYDELRYIKKIIPQQIAREEELLGFTNKSGKTLQCQIMDIADENCYLVSDIVDSLNIMSATELSQRIKEEVAPATAESITKALFKSKNAFVNKMQKLFFSFCDNFILDENGFLVPLDESIEEIRKGLARLNVKYVLNSKTVEDLRKENSKILDYVFDFFLTQNDDIKNIPSSFYKKQLKNAYSEKERIIVLRNMLGALTDKGIKKLFRQIIKKGE